MTPLPRPLTAEQFRARRENARKSTGPRSAAGKQRAAFNALRSGEYARVTRPVIVALGEQPQEYAELLASLLAAHRPANAAERLLVEELAALHWQRQRNQRAQAGQLRLQVERTQSAHYRRLLELQNEGCQVSQEEVLEKGLLHVEDSRGKFQQVSEILQAMIAQLERGQIGPDWNVFVRTLYGAKPSMRGVGILNHYESLRAAGFRPSRKLVKRIGGKAVDLGGLDKDARSRGEEEGGQGYESRAGDEPGFADPEMQIYMLEEQFVDLHTTLLEEARESLEKYKLYLEEEVAFTPAMRDACFVPLDRGWVMLLRQENSIDRRIERKTRLLMQMRNARRRGPYRPRARAENGEMQDIALAPLAPDPHE
jgi:hypothetical protein